MKNNYIELFVPGRLCLVGEHSDWAGKYRSQNNSIEKGYAIDDSPRAKLTGFSLRALYSRTGR